MTSPPAPINGVAAHLLARNSQSNSRTGSPMASNMNANNVNQDINMHHGNHVQNNTSMGAGMLMHNQNVNSAHHHLAQQNANLFAQLNSQLSTITSQLNCANEMNDLPPPPPIPEQVQNVKEIFILLLSQKLFVLFHDFFISHKID